MSRSLAPCGTRAAYERHRARGELICDACREANRVARRQMQAVLMQVPRSQVPHGLNGYDNYGCRCEVCSGAKAAKNGDYREFVRARRPGVAVPPPPADG